MMLSADERIGNSPIGNGGFRILLGWAIFVRVRFERKNTRFFVKFDIIVAGFIEKTRHFYAV